MEDYIIILLMQLLLESIIETLLPTKDEIELYLKESAQAQEQRLPCASAGGHSNNASTRKRKDFRSEGEKRGDGGGKKRGLSADQDDELDESIRRLLTWDMKRRGLVYLSASAIEKHTACAQK
jgi:hypothetical protein